MTSSSLRVRPDRSLRDIIYLNKQLYGEDKRFLEQFNSSYSLHRHMGGPALFQRAQKVSQRIAASKEAMLSHSKGSDDDGFDFSNWRPEMLRDDRRLGRVRLRIHASAATGP